MDAIWYGIATLFEWIFAAAKPIGYMANVFFIAVGFIGTFYWLWYDLHVNKGGKNFMSEGPEKR
jgi:ABC-type anion transport system duplicated permease subunit